MPRSIDLANTVLYALRHPISRRAPLRTLQRMLAWQLGGKGDRIVPWINDTVLVARKGMHAATGNVYWGLYEVVSMAFLTHLLRYGDDFVDGGANIGSYSILASKVAKARVFAFEPAAETLPDLHANLEANSAQVQVYPIALGDTEGSASFSVGLGCMNKLDGDGSTSVQVRTLDSFRLRPTAIKADLEGGELGMLRGAEETLKHTMAIVIETVDDEAEAILRRHGFFEIWYNPFKRTIQDSCVYKDNNHIYIKDRDIVSSRVARGPAIKWGRLSI